MHPKQPNGNIKAKTWDLLMSPRNGELKGKRGGDLNGGGRAFSGPSSLALGVFSGWTWGISGASWSLLGASWSLLGAS